MRETSAQVHHGYLPTSVLDVNPLSAHVLCQDGSIWNRHNDHFAPCADSAIASCWCRSFSSTGAAAHPFSSCAEVTEETGQERLGLMNSHVLLRLNADYCGHLSFTCPLGMAQLQHKKAVLLDSANLNIVSVDNHSLVLYHSHSSVPIAVVATGRSGEVATAGRQLSCTSLLR